MDSLPFGMARNQSVCCILLAYYNPMSETVLIKLALELLSHLYSINNTLYLPSQALAVYIGVFNHIRLTVSHMAYLRFEPILYQNFQTHCYL